MSLRLRIGLSSSDVVQNDRRFVRKLMVMARMPEDPSKTFKHLKQPSNNFKAMYACTCTPVGPTDNNSHDYNTINTDNNNMQYG
eukprot:296538-Heterocapsa_arctica.AAC.1